MRVLLIAAAGMSSRFERSLGRPCLKCLYYERSFSESLLSRMLRLGGDFDRCILVGGWRFPELQEAVERHFPDRLDRIVMVENREYARYGTGWSLFLGLRKALELGAQEVVLAEGDLFVDRESFERAARSGRDVITSSREPILARSSVAFYYDMQGKIHYLYDPEHRALEISGPFLGIFSSGQVWKFANPRRLRQVWDGMSPSDWQGTNLVFAERYFQGLAPEEYENISFEAWVNCNTVLDFRRGQKLCLL